ncbi:MAG: DNA-3-methyladenine glycosylase family protein [Actinomycetota bacterium]
MRTRTLHPDGPLDLRLTLAALRDGAGDPCMRIGASRVLRATRTPAGLATTLFVAHGEEMEVQAWGPGAGWALDASPDLLGLHDDPAAFRPAHERVRKLHLRLAGMRIGRSLAVFEALLPVIIGQKVSGMEARRAYRSLVRRYGEAAPGPFGLVAPPAPERLAALGYYAFHPLGIERKRAETIRRAAAEAHRLEKVVELDPRAARRRLEMIVGIGPWSSAHTTRVALGDPDAVIVGDLHLPHTVAYALAGEERATDARMLELLAPYAGQRGRAQRLIAIGCPHAPRRAPRRRLRNFARI